MQRLTAGLVLGVSLAAVPAFAQAPAAPADNVKRDPRGIQGISPFWEAIVKGDNAYVARDFDTAIAAYKKAIEAKPQDGLGHLRLGAAELAKGNAEEAEKAFQQAVRFGTEDPKVRAKAEFCLADLQERKKAYDAAAARWRQYGDFVKSKPDAKGHEATAAERVKRVEEWKKLSADSAEVKLRIEKRVKEADESMRKSSK
jgi:tetratricopeptide (TPR) repeat protein